MLQLTGRQRPPTKCILEPKWMKIECTRLVMDHMTPEEVAVFIFTIQDMAILHFANQLGGCGNFMRQDGCLVGRVPLRQ